MKTRICILIAALTAAFGLSCANAGAQNSGDDFFDGFFGQGFPFGQSWDNSGQRTNRKNVKVIYDLDFEYYFDNRENETSDSYYSPSMTINSVRLTPTAGIEIAQRNNLNHRLMLGIDIQKNMGESPTGDYDKSLRNWDLFKEITLYYRLRWRNEKNILTGYAGMFPRHFCGEKYSTAFISDSLRFFDNNLEGIMLQLERPKAFYEIGCDWCGMYGSKRREKFAIFSYGEGSLLPWLSAGWTFYGIHYANSEEYRGVVDNNLAQLFLRFDFTGRTGFQDLSTKISFLQGAHQDRKSDNGFIFPNGFEHELSIRRWNVGIDNRFYFGANLMPFYDNIEPSGHKFGTGLYQNDPHYRIHRSPLVESNKYGGYDRLEAYYQPKIASFLDLKVAVVLHFAGDFNKPSDFGFAGWQQKFSLLFNLDKLMHPQKGFVKSSARRGRNNSGKESRISGGNGHTI